jgi:hypothetical protein
MDAPVSLTIDPINILGEAGNLKDAEWFFEMQMEGDTKEKMGHVLEGASTLVKDPVLRSCLALAQNTNSLAPYT